MKTKPSILCVDDEPQLLEGLALHLRRHYELFTAPSGPTGLEVLAAHPSISVVVSDMRMPGMDGATFLSHVRARHPATVRLLLTGQTDLESAISAVNDGQLFRFLTKPCPPPALLTALAAAVEQHRLITSERVLLEETLHGAIKTLTDVLALLSPATFGRATRLKQIVGEMSEKLAFRERWQVEVAAMLSHLGYVTLSPELADKVYYDRALSKDEQALVDKLPTVTEQLIGNIPRMENVLEILRRYRRAPRPSDLEAKDAVTRGAQILKVAFDYDTLESGTGESPQLTLDTLRGRAGQYDAEVLAALLDVRSQSNNSSDVRELSMYVLKVGMVFVDDVKMPNGVLLVARGYAVTERFMERVHNLPEEIRKARWRVRVGAKAA
jgi:response regulator RpfG family c-di-GMP phosphodiesterase